MLLTESVLLFAVHVIKKRRAQPFTIQISNESPILSWDAYFMAIAILSGMRSNDPVRKVGACVVDDKNRIISIGYNGFPRGCADCDLPWTKHSKNWLDTKYPYYLQSNDLEDVKASEIVFAFYYEYSKRSSLRNLPLETQR
jgi:deoxycytidylate deaminase